MSNSSAEREQMMYRNFHHPAARSQLLGAVSKELHG
jgi:hypothetical protein